MTGARWFALAAYALLAACTQLLWLTFAPITTETARALHVDVGAAGDLAAIFPLVYIVLALPTGRWLDARFTHALGAGAALTAAGAVIRMAAPASFVVQVAGQLVVAAGQPLVLNAINKVAARHFPPAERATAISVGTVALFVGILAAVLAGGPLYAAGGLPLVLGTQGAVSIVAALLVGLSFRIPPAFPDDPAAASSLRWLLRDRFIWALAALVFLGMGTYNAVATWLEAILDQYGEGAAAGDLVAVMTFAGIVGAALLPAPAAARDARRLLLLGALALSVVAFAVLPLGRSVLWWGAWLAADGLLLMAALPVVLDWADVHAGPERQGGAVGFLMLAGNLGGLVLVVLVQAVLAVAPSAVALLALAAVSAAGIPVALRLLPATTASGSAGTRASSPTEV